MMGFFCALPVISALLGSCAPPSPFATGYVEGEFALVAPVAVAQIESLRVSRGDRVEKGDVLARLTQRDAEIALAEAEASLARAKAALANLTEGKRPEEIRVIEAALASARAQAAEAERSRERISSLAARGAATTAQRDDAVTAAEVANARVAQTEADLAVARLPARPQEIAAAEATVAGAVAARDSALWHLEERTLLAAATGTVFDVIRIPGEIAGPTAPVVSLLPDGAVKLRLYVPEIAVSQIAVGSMLDVRCDACPEGLRARVTYVSDEAEFTPPVIYSLENRQRLVYLIEAQPDAGSPLKPGQIVDVALPEPDE